MLNDACTNEVIAEWIGFKQRFTSCNLSDWWELEGYPQAKCPDFANSETDCFRFIIPKLREMGYGVDITVGRVGTFINLWKFDEKHDNGLDNTTAIGIGTSVSAAICMAVLGLTKNDLMNDNSSLRYN